MRDTWHSPPERVTMIRVRNTPGPTLAPAHDHLHTAFGLSAFSKYFPSRLSPPGRRCTHPLRLRLTRLGTGTLLLDRKLSELLPIHQTVRLHIPARSIFTLTCAPNSKHRLNHRPCPPFARRSSPCRSISVRVLQMGSQGPMLQHPPRPSHGPYRRHRGRGRAER